MLAHRRQPVCCPFGGHRAVNCCEACSWQKILTDHSRVSIYTLCKAFRQRRGIFKVRRLCLVQLWNVFVLPSSVARKNQYSVVFLCITVWKIYVSWLFFPCRHKIQNRSFLWCSPLQLVTSSDSGAKLLHHWSFGRNVLSVCLSPMQIWYFKYAALVWYHFECSSFLCRHSV